LIVRPSNEFSTPSPEQQGGEVNLLDILLLVKLHWRLLVALPVVFSVVGFGASWLMTPRYTAVTQIMVPQPSQASSLSMLASGASGGLLSAAALPGLKNPADQWVGLLSSRTVADALIDRFELMQAYGATLRMHARDTLAASTRIQGKRDGLIQIEVDDSAPERAAQLANGYVEALQRLSSNLAVTEAAQRRVFLEKQLAQAMERLRKAEASMRGAGVSVDFLKLSPDATVNRLAQLRAEIASREVQVAVLRGTMTESNPELQRVLASLRALRGQLAQLERAEASGQQAAGEAGMPAGYADAYREYRYQETLYDLLARQLEIAKADELREGAMLQVVDAAQVPEWKSSPKRAFLALTAGMIGLLIALVWVVVRVAVRHYRADPANAAKLEQLRA
jgi:uncharacterized protein involved in exopolysaccharide biosynthesis